MVPTFKKVREVHETFPSFFYLVNFSIILYVKNDSHIYVKLYCDFLKLII